MEQVVRDTELSRAEQAKLIDQWITTGRARELRLRAGLTLAKAGQDVEVDAAAVLKWERGEHRPRGRNLRAYYRFLASLDHPSRPGS